MSAFATLKHVAAFLAGEANAIRSGKVGGVRFEGQVSCLDGFIKESECQMSNDPPGGAILGCLAWCDATDERCNFVYSKAGRGDGMGMGWHRGDVSDEFQKRESKPGAGAEHAWSVFRN